MLPDSLVLTKGGWLSHDQVQPGDETIGFNPQSGHSEWTAISAVHCCEDAPLVRLKNKSWTAVCTPSHRWMSSRLRQIDHRRTVNGLRSGRLTSYRSDEFVETGAIMQFHSLRLAAPADTGSDLAISDGEAELLGWVMGDGFVSRYDTRWAASSPLGDEILRVADENPQASHREIGRIVGSTHQTVGAYLRSNGRTTTGAHARTGTGSMIRIGLTQAKPEGVVAIDALLKQEGIPLSRHVYPPKGIAKLDRVEWRLRAAYSAEFLKRSGYDHHDPMPFVLSLSPSQRDGFLRGFFGAEGHQAPAGEAFGRGPYLPAKLYSQADGPSQDAIALAIYLSGQRPSFHPWSASSRARFDCSSGANIGATKPFIGGRAIKTEDIGHAPVLCFTTGLGTWTARQGSQVWLTGSSVCSDPREDAHPRRNAVPTT